MDFKLILKIFFISVFALTSLFSLLMFPFLIDSSNDLATNRLGYSYLFLFILSLFSVIFILRKLFTEEK